MKNWKILVLFIVISACAGMGQMMSDGKSIDRESNVSENSFRDANNKEMAALKEGYKKLKATSGATIIRGNEKIWIDLGLRTGVEKIKDGDIIQLRTGYYSHFPVIDKEVTIRGVSQLETLIGPLFETSNKLLVLKGKKLTFEKLTLANFRVAPVVGLPSDYQNQYHYRNYRFTFIQCHILNGYGSNKYGDSVGRYGSVRLILSKAIITGDDLNSPFMDEEAYYSYVKFNRPFGYKEIRTTEKFFKLKGGQYWKSYTKSLSGGTESPEDLLALENFKRDEFLSVDPRVVMAIKANMNAEVKYLDQSRGEDRAKVGKATNRELHDIVQEAFPNSAVSDSQTTIKYLELAQAASKRGHSLSAALASALALEENPFSDANRKTYLGYLAKVADRYGCSKKFVKVENPGSFNEVVRRIYPILGLNAKNSVCKLTYTTPSDFIVQSMSPEKVVRTEYVWKETDESMKNRWAMENARRQAEQDYNTARFRKSADEIAKAGQSFARSRARLVSVGGTQALLIQKKTEPIKADPLLKLQEDQAKKRLEAVGKMDSNKKMEKKANTITTEYLNRIEEYQGELEMHVKGQPVVIVKGPLVRNESSKSCVTRRDHLGRVLTDMNSQQCFVNTVGNNNILAYKYIKNEIFDQFVEPLYGLYFSRFVGPMDNYLSASDDYSKLEGNLLAIALNYNSQKDDKAISALSMGVLGKTLKHDEVVKLITLED